MKMHIYVFVVIDVLRKKRRRNETCFHENVFKNWVKFFQFIARKCCSWFVNQETCVGSYFIQNKTFN